MRAHEINFELGTLNLELDVRPPHGSMLRIASCFPLFPKRKRWEAPCNSHKPRQLNDLQQTALPFHPCKKSKREALPLSAHSPHLLTAHLSPGLNLSAPHFHISQPGQELRPPSPEK